MDVYRERPCEDGAELKRRSPEDCQQPTESGTGAAAL